jgi:cell growth-regulating nucleolar protein
LYREKPSKASKRKSVSIVEPGSHNALVPRNAYVEDDPEGDVPPAVPDPPPPVLAPPVEAVNVFDYLVNEETPNASRTSLGGSHEPMTMKKDAPTIFAEGKDERMLSRAGYRNREEQELDDNYIEHGFSYGAEPVKPLPYPHPNGSLVSLDFMTPSAKATRAKLDRIERPTHSRTNSGNASDKKRKRGEVDEHRYELAGDTVMPDVANGANAQAETPGLPHSGLTGGLTRLLSHPSPFPPSPEYSDDRDRAKEYDHNNRQSHKHEDPTSPLKRTRHSKEDTGLGISIKGRAGKVRSIIGGATVAGALAAFTNPAAAQNGNHNRELALVRAGRRRTSSSDDGHTRGRETQVRDRKKHKVHRQHGSTSARYERPSHHSRSKRRESNENESPDAGRRKMKAIEYHKHDRDESGSDSEDSDPRVRKGGPSDMVVFGKEEKMRIRAESFLSVVRKGPESEKGYSMNKALKRWHRDGGTGNGAKHEEEKELWRSLRLKRNDRGEVVIFF